MLAMVSNKSILTISAEGVHSLGRISTARFEAPRSAATFEIPSEGVK
jgi:hypothetical protein